MYTANQGPASAGRRCFHWSRPACGPLIGGCCAGTIAAAQTSPRSSDQCRAPTLQRFQAKMFMNVDMLPS